MVDIRRKRNVNYAFGGLYRICNTHLRACLQKRYQHKHTQAHMRTHTCPHTHIHVRMKGERIRMLTRTHTCTHAHTHACIRTHTRVHIPTHITIDEALRSYPSISIFKGSPRLYPSMSIFNGSRTEVVVTSQHARRHACMYTDAWMHTCKHGRYMDEAAAWPLHGRGSGIDRRRLRGDIVVGPPPGNVEHTCACVEA